VNIAYAVLGIDGAMYMMDMCVVCIWYCAHVGYVVLCTNDAMYMLDMQSYVHMVFYACCTYGAMEIWFCVHDCTSGVVSMWCHVHVVHVVL